MRVRRLQEELQQTKPFASSRQEAMLALMKTADVVRRAIGGILEPHGVTLQQYNVLRILRGAGPDGLPTLSIAPRLIEETPGVTRLLDRMEARSWVKRVRCEKDRRVVYAVITRSALALLENIDPLLAQHESKSLPLLEEAEVRQLIVLLERARAQEEQ
ncbi:MAG: MarR family transcriptional regulator [Bryobacterales bacterium]|nr:MarR family transcriptional regulator [Bryobacterales bacterium]